MITINKLIADSIVITTGPVVKPETHIKFVDGTEDDYLLEGNVGYQYLEEKGLVSSAGGGAPEWINQPTEITIGTAMTGIGDYTFAFCYSLTSITIPSSVTSIGNNAFYDCSELMNVTFCGKTMATVQGMANYSWYLPSGCVIHCTDGDITL